MATDTLSAFPDLGQSFVRWKGGLHVGSNFAQITLTSNTVIVAEFTHRPELSAPRGLAGPTPDGFRTLLSGEFGASYEVFGSSNLTSWEHLGRISNTFGASQFTDFTSTNASKRFYKALLSK